MKEVILDSSHLLLRHTPETSWSQPFPETDIFGILISRIQDSEQASPQFDVLQVDSQKRKKKKKKKKNFTIHQPFRIQFRFQSWFQLCQTSLFVVEIEHRTSNGKWTSPELGIS